VGETLQVKFRDGRLLSYAEYGVQLVARSSTCTGSWDRGSAAASSTKQPEPLVSASSRPSGLG
jgi:hypothetical protein